MRHAKQMDIPDPAVPILMDGFLLTEADEVVEATLERPSVGGEERKKNVQAPKTRTTSKC